MDTKVLKDVIICSECSGKMFPSSFDKSNRIISYRCCNDGCKAKKEYSFDDVLVKDGEKIKYFLLTDDGVLSWKCAFHGCCDCFIDNVLDDDFSKFENACCIWGKSNDEILKENNYVATEGKIIIEKILSALDDKQISELADVFEIDFDEYDDYVEAFLDCFDFMTNDFRGFVYSLTGEIKYLFDIDIDEFGNVRR